MLIYTLIAAMLLVYVPAVRSYLNLRQAFAEACHDLDRQLLLRRFDYFAGRLAEEHFDVVFTGADRSELEASWRGALRALEDLRRDAEDAEVPALDAMDRALKNLHQTGQQFQELGGGSLVTRLAAFRDSMSATRDQELLPAVDETLSRQASIFEDRLLAVSGQLLLVPFIEVDIGAIRLRDAGVEAIVAADFAQQVQRLVLEYQDFAFLDGAWHKLYLARGKAEQAYESWQNAMVASAEEETAITDDLLRDATRSYHDLNRLGGRLVDLSEEESKTRALSAFETELEPLIGRALNPALVAVMARYDAHIDDRVRSVERQIDLVGYVLAAFAVVVALLALVSPRLMSRWIVQPIDTLIHATRTLGAGDLSGQVVITGAADELGELASCFNQMVVDLRQAQDQLGRRERLVVLGQLAGGVAHEIRNPLGVMKNSIYFLRLTQKLKDEKAMQHLGLIEDEIARANRIITELLDYARDPTSEIGPVALQEAFYRAIAEVEIPDAVRVEHEFPDQPLEVIGDGGQIERVLSNFIRNAVQAMPDGGTLTLACERQNGETIASVTDTGVGIAEDQIARIFEPLYTGKAKGIGLGLPLCQRYAELNDGRIDCQSEVDRGSTFRLILPLAVDLKRNAHDRAPRQA